MKPTILVVDDEPSGQQVVESILQDQGYQIEFASTGKEALNKAVNIKPDLILLDIMLPEVDGLQVCQLLRKNLELAKTPIVMLTALSDRDIRIASMDAGADDFFTKPFDRAELRARVRSITQLSKYRLLYERNQMFSWISERASDGYLLLQNGDQIAYANPRARFYLGMDMDSSGPLKLKFMEVVKKQYETQPFEAWSTWPAPITSDNYGVRYLVRPESNSSHEFWLEVTISELPKGEAESQIVRMRDVTSDILNRRNTRSFGEAITHKVRTPVTHIVSSLDLLARHADKLSTEEITKLSETALMGAKRLSDTLDRILKYARLYSNVNASEGFNMGEFQELVERIASEIGNTKVTVNMQENLKHVEIVISLQSMEVILWEILGNSRKFHPAGFPNVIVEVFAGKANMVNFQFTDDGVSLSPKQLATAWLPYYQGEKDFTGETPGMGLGLSTVNAIVWGAGGLTQMLNRKDGPGVVIRLSIPVVRHE